jgi:hypothetical protein
MDLDPTAQIGFGRLGRGSARLAEQRLGCAALLLAAQAGGAVGRRWRAICGGRSSESALRGSVSRAEMPRRERRARGRRWRDRGGAAVVGEGTQRRGMDVVLWRAILSAGEGEREGNEVATLLTSRQSSGCAWLARKGGGEGD